MIDMSESFQGQTNESDTTKVIAIGGGKGGVGKTVISASISIGLSKMRKRVVAVDADMAGADLHLILGIEKPQKTSHQFFKREFDNLHEVLLEHPQFPNLRFLGGAIGALGAANMKTFQILKFIRHVRKLDADYIIIDLGAGNNYRILDLFLAADQGVVVVTPDPMSIHEGYNFIKLALYRRLIKTLRRDEEVIDLIKNIASTETHRTERTMYDFLQDIQHRNGALVEKVDAVLSGFRPMLITNMLDESKDRDKVLAIKAAARELLSIDVQYLGGIRRDEKVKDAVDEMEPFISYDPNSPASRDLAEIIIIELLHKSKFQSFRENRGLRKRLSQKGEREREVTICSVQCIYWEDCGFRNGGYPCELKYTSGFGQFR